MPNGIQAGGQAAALAASWLEFKQQLHDPVHNRQRLVRRVRSGRVDAVVRGWDGGAGLMTEHGGVVASSIAATHRYRNP
eukprot:3682568-Pleurochrysis_carterae.AAC.1